MAFVPYPTIPAMMGIRAYDHHAYPKAIVAVGFLSSVSDVAWPSLDSVKSVLKVRRNYNNFLYTSCDAIGVSKKTGR